MKTRILCIILSLLLLFSGCATGSSATESQQTDADILAKRRETVQAYMRSMNEILWRADETFTYTVATGNIEIVAGRLYKGLPYTGASASDVRLLDHVSEYDSKGIPIISGLDDIVLGSPAKKAIIGNDCSGAVWLSWSQFSTSISGFKASTRQMTQNNGYLRVGNYESEEDTYSNTLITCENNTKEVMFKAYAQLQPGDAVVYYNGSKGHAMMVVENTIRERDGAITGSSSCIKIVDQTSGTKNSLYYDEKLQEDVYYIGNIEKVYSYIDLFSQGYLPVTCKELNDPSPLPEEKITDSETTATVDNIFQGTFSSNYLIDSVTITITDASGNAAQTAICYNRESNRRSLDLAKFLTAGEPIVKGAIDLASLPSGTYHCKHVCRTPYGIEHTMREFDFTI